MNRRLYIDALIYKKNKAYGYQEYLFNLLDYFYCVRETINYAEVVLLIPQAEIESFKRYGDVFKIMPFAIQSKLQHLKIQNTLNRYITFNANDVILCTYNYSSLRKYCHQVLVVHDLLFLRKRFLPNYFMRMQRKISIPISLKKSDKIIAISNFTKNDIMNNYKIPQSKIVTIYNYFNFKKYTITEDYFKCTKPYFVSICSNAYHKNTISVLRAFEDFCKTDANFDIVFVGSLTNQQTEAYKFYQNLSNDIKKRIHLLSHISNENLGMVYRNAKCFISLTLFEGLGMPIVEAMYFGLPLILSDLEICREIVSDNPAFFVNPYDITVISNAMKVVAYEKHTKKDENIRVRFSQENTSKKYIELLNSFIN